MKKSLGQNFLIDKNIVNKIIDSGNIDETTLVIEIGPGKGALTKGLLERAGKVIAIEIDRDLIPYLEDKFGGNTQFELIHDDILNVNLRNIVDKNKEDFDKILVLGNLPYYITSPIIMKVFEDHVDADELIFMTQKEVADRLVSGPGTKAYGAISVAVQYYSTVEKVMNVSREVFIPKPKVESSVLRFKVREKPPVDVDENMYFKVVKAGFSQRRKTLLNTLSTLGLNKERIRTVLEDVGIDPIRRAETLSLEEFALVANSLGEIYERTTGENTR